MKTAIFYTPKFLGHDPGPDHPDTPARLRVIMEELNRSGLLQAQNCIVIEPKPADLEYVELVHELDYIKLVKKACDSGGGILDLGDTVVSPKSCEAAFLAAGALVDAVDLVQEGKTKNAIAFVRPPGHHAGPYYALGFCLFNNIAIAAAYSIYRLNFNRILILDIDAHHGNGTQETFYNTRKVLYISLHEDSRAFPGTGFVDEVGEGEGIGYTVNVPLPFRSDDAIHRHAFDDVAMPIATQYKPQLILVSAGFDGHYTDPVGSLSLSVKAYEETFKKIVNLADQLCEGKLVVTLEGGYSLNFLGKMAASAVARMADAHYIANDKGPTAKLKVKRKAEQEINDAKRIQSSFWKL